jgi:hypothetical protein
MEKEKMTTCVWCGMSYPDDDEGYPMDGYFMRLKGLYGSIDKVICIDCYEHLKLIRR